MIACFDMLGMLSEQDFTSSTVLKCRDKSVGPQVQCVALARIVRRVCMRRTNGR